MTYDFFEESTSERKNPPYSNGSADLTAKWDYIGKEPPTRWRLQAEDLSSPVALLPEEKPRAPDQGGQEDTYESHAERALEKEARLEPLQKPSYASEEEWALYLSDRDWFEDQKRKGRVSAEHRGKWVAVYHHTIMSHSDFYSLLDTVNQTYPSNALLYYGEYEVEGTPIEIILPWFHPW